MKQQKGIDKEKHKIRAIKKKKRKGLKKELLSKMDDK